MYTIRKEFTFSAAHCLMGLPNEHPCSRLHGHNYIVTVELECDMDCLTHIGFVKDYRELEPIKKYIDETFDHRYLNDVISFNPTAELLARHLYHRFIEQFPRLKAVEVSETPKTNARYVPEATH